MKTRLTVAVTVCWIGLYCLSIPASAQMVDNDGDGMADGWERSVGLDPSRNDSQLDPDRDGLTNLDEYRHGADPFREDADDDGLSDGEEVDRYGTWPAMADTDGGGRSDGYEVAGGGNPLNPDDDAAGQSVSISLQAGWNMFSVPLVPGAAAVTSVLMPIAGAYKSIWSYDRGKWRCFDPANSGFSDLERIEPGRGYWINMKEASRLTVSGTPVDGVIFLYRGWNLVGYTASFPQSVEAALSSVDEGCVVSIWSFQRGAWRLYDPESPVYSDLTELTPGDGYWIETDRDCEWRLPF